MRDNPGARTDVRTAARVQALARPARAAGESPAGRAAGAPKGASPHDRREDPQRPPIEPLKRAFTLRFHSPAQLDRIKQATLDILETVGVQVPLGEGPRHPRRARLRGRPRAAGRHVPTRRRARGHGDGAALLRPRRPRPVVCVFHRRRHHVLHDRRLWGRDRRLRHGRQAALDQGRPRARHAPHRLPVVDRLLVAHGLGRRLRRDRAAARARRRLEQHRQAPAGHGQRRARGALRGRDGDRHRRRRRAAAPPAGALRSDRHHLASGAGQGRHRSGPRVRRGRRARDLRHHADAGHDGAGHACRRLRRRRGRAGERHRPRAARVSGRTRGPLDHAELRRPAHRRHS